MQLLRIIPFPFLRSCSRLHTVSSAQGSAMESADQPVPEPVSEGARDQEETQSKVKKPRKLDWAM